MNHSSIVSLEQESVKSTKVFYLQLINEQNNQEICESSQISRGSPSKIVFCRYGSVSKTATLLPFPAPSNTLLRTTNLFQFQLELYYDPDM